MLAAAMHLTTSYRIAKVWGIPIKAHLSLLLLIPFLNWDMGFLLALMLGAGVLITITLHELGHSYVAIRKGARVREILLLPIGGVARIQSLPTRPRDEFLMAAAGPAVSFALFVILFFGGRLLPVRVETLLPLLHRFPSLHVTPVEILAIFLQLLGITNLVWVVFNLVPAFPMDGGRILRAALSPRMGHLRATRLAVAIGKSMAIAFGFLAFRYRIWSLGLIAIFIYLAAGQEYRAAVAQEMWKRWGAGKPPEPDAAREETAGQAVIGPAPYEKNSNVSRTDVRQDPPR